MTTKTSGRLERIVAAVHGNPGHDYPEDWERENGMYMSTCVKTECRESFTGGKYRFVCKRCNLSLPGNEIK